MEEPALTSLEAIVHPEHTALVVVDIQNDFCHPQGYYGRHTDVSLVEAMLPRLRAFLEQSRKTAVRVAFTQQLYDQEHISGPLVDRWARLGVTERYLSPGTWGAALCDFLSPRPQEAVFPKYRYSTFHTPDFETWLTRHDIRTLVVTGVTTNVCVESTARDAFMRDYYVVLPEDCVAAYTERAHQTALDNVRQFFGRVCTANELVHAWGRNPYQRHELAAR